MYLVEKNLLTFYQISDVIGNTTCEEDFQKIKNARQYYINFTDYLTTQKAVEYNSNTKTMTIWHQGLHKCWLHPGNKSKEEGHQAKETVKRVMRKFLKMSRHKRAGARAAMEDGKPKLADYITKSYEDLKLYNTVKKDMHKTLLGTE